MDNNEDKFPYNKLFNMTIPILLPDKSNALGTVEGWMVHTDDEGKIYSSGKLLVRVDPRTFTKQGRKYFTQFTCLNPNGTASCLYIIPKEIVRRNVEGEISKTTPKRTKSK